MNRESPLRTLLVAAAVALVCSIAVSTAVYVLRPIQLAYGAIERNRFIVEAAGLTPDGGALSEREIVDLFLELETRIVDLRTGEFSSAVDPFGYDPIAAARDPATSAPIDADRDIAELGRRAHYAPVYLIENNGRVELIVLPIQGQGMWSTIHGYVSLEGDFNTIASISFSEHGETPGIGDRILDPGWRMQWRGKRLYDADGNLQFRIAQTRVSGNPTDYRVDAITGATVTVNRVGNMIRYWFGDDGFGPFLERLRQTR